MITKLMHLPKMVRYRIDRAWYKRSRRMLPQLPGGEAAYGLDMLVSELLAHKRNGVFVDIGANDGVTISNTLYFEKNLGWTGIAVEPVPRIFAQLKENRKCTVVHGCVTAQPGKAKFLEVIGVQNMLSTLLVNDIGLTARRIRKYAKQHNDTVNEIEVDCVTLESLLIRNQIGEIDLLSVDTEGGELEILRSIDFDKNPVHVIVVENNYFKDDIQHYLAANGFLYIGTFNVDEVYFFGGKALRAQLKIGVNGRQ